jgi:hypothetical protein
MAVGSELLRKRIAKIVDAWFTASRGDEDQERRRGNSSNEWYAQHVDT